MIVRQGCTRSRRRAPRGQMMVLFALTITVLMGALLLGVDLTRLRTEAENAQRAANAAALAGAVYLPDYQNDAYTRANEEAAKNGFVSGQRGVTVTPGTVPGYSTRLRVTVTEPASLVFGGVFGLGPKTISRSATAEYDVPLQMGAPDYVLGYAPFPTSMMPVSATPSGPITPTQGFYLEARGPYGQQENGDAYSQYFESYATGGLNPTNAYTTYLTNPCTLPPTPTSSSSATPVPLVNGCPNLTANPDVARIGGAFNGYDYVVDNPVTQTLIIKLFDPYDEGPYQRDASPTNGSIISPYNTRYPDQFASCSAGNTQFCSASSISGTASGPYPAPLQFTLSGPYQTVYDTGDKTINTTVATAGTPVAGTTGGYTCSTDCVLAAPFVAGDDPTHIKCIAPPGTCGTQPASPYAYKFLNYAIIHEKGIFHIHVQVTGNTAPPYAGTYGTGGNIFGLAACALAPGGTPVLGTTADPSAGGVNGAAVSDPYDPVTGWNPASCPNPNLTPIMQTTYPACANPATAPTDQCVHIYGLNRMCIYVNLSSGQSLIPLGYVPTEYEGKTLQVNLYDVGDSTSGNIEVLTPAADLGHIDVPNQGFPTSLNYTYSAAPTDPNSGYKIATETPSIPAGTHITVTNSSGAVYNGSWLKIKIPIVIPGKSYYNMVNGTPATPGPATTAFGGYWKMLYNVGGGNDTTTWEIAVNGAPVHLVAP